MVKRLSGTILLLIFCFGAMATPCLAAKKRIWTTVKTTTGNSSSVNPGVSAVLTGWKQYLKLSFRGVAATNGITYELIYNGSGTEQGVFGGVNVTEGNVTRSLFFGTCSHNVCVAHKNISSIKLTITYKLKNGQETVKRYRVKY